MMLGGVKSAVALCLNLAIKALHASRVNTALLPDIILSLRYIVLV